MSTYSDSLSEIRKVRIARDKVKEELYKTQLKIFTLSKEQKKFLNKEMVSGDADTQAINALRKQIADLQNQLKTIDDQLAQIQSLTTQLNSLNKLKDELTASIAKLQAQIAAIDKELSNRSIQGERRNQLLTQKKTLQDQLKAQQDKLAELNKEINVLTKQFSSLKDRQSGLTRQKAQIEKNISELQKSLDTAVQQNQKFYPDRTKDIENAKKTLDEQKTILNSGHSNVRTAINNLFGQLTPQQLIEQWNARKPIMLLPVRMETKYKTSDRLDQLWVRIFPDDVSVVTHESILTQQEVDAGISHWKALWLAKGDSIKKQASWTLLSQSFGVNRASWVALQTKPQNWATSAGLASENGLIFPTFDLTKPASWTQAPHTRIMPDRFVLLGYRNGELKFSKIGNQVDDIVILGPAPLADGENPSLTRNPKDNRIEYGDDFKWVADFNLAVQAGLGFVINNSDLQKNDSVTQGFDQLLAIGLKLSCDDTDGKLLLEDLLDNHNFSIDGLSLIKQGTPTNNTEEKDAGYSKKGSIDNISDYIENGTHLFEFIGDVNSATDGQRLAEYLGIEYSFLQLVPNTQIKDNVEAVAMNKALYASTLGYFLNSMLNEVLSDSAILQLRDHFTNYVTGRGPIAAIRVGNQPYGIIPTSSFSKWKYSEKRSVVGFSSNDFLNQLCKFLLFLDAFWKNQVPKLSYIHQQGDPGANLISVLGLNPSSVEFFQRVGYSYDYLKDLEAFKWGGTYFGDVFKMAIEQSYAKTILKNFGYNDTETGGTPKPVPLLLQLVFQHFNTKLDKNNLIDGQPLSEDTTIKPYDNVLGHPNFVDWLIANISDSTKIENQDFGGAKAPNSLLYMLLKNSLLLETSQSLFKYFQNNNIVANELIRSRKFMNITSTPSVSHWEVFQAPANKVVTTESSASPLFEFIHSPVFTGPAGKGVVENLDEFKWALGVLTGMSTASLERAMTEHLDTLAYRLDTWQTSIFDLRLREYRNIISENPERDKGIFIGAYGYLENVKPSINKRTKISEQILPEGLRENTDNLYTESNNGGYVHAPSLNHATAAAILRSGYLTHANSTDNEILSVNLSSERVRRAKYLVDGIRNGQTLEVLLGYQFERGLHDWSTRPVNPVILNQLIPIFRKAFPIKKTKVPQEGKVTGPEEVIEDFSVVNGLALAQVTSGFPFGISTFPVLSSDQISAITTEKDNIDNTLDALKDLLTSESAYQLALGNFDRAAAVMQAISDSHMPPDIQVIDSARGTDMAFTNRVGIHFDSLLNTNPWAPTLMTEKAMVEPGMNNWMGTLLGDPVKIRCFVKAIDKDGNELTDSGGNKIEDTVSLDDLKIQPINFIYLIRNKLDQTGTSELEGRVRYFFAVKNNLSDDTLVNIEFAKSNSSGDNSIKSFAEILPFANYLRNIVSGSRPLKATDYDSSSKKVPVSTDNPDNIDVTELQTRVENTFADFDTLMSQLQTALNDATTIKTEPVVNNLRDKLKAIADAGLVFAFPQSAVGFDQKQIDILAAQGQSVLDRFDNIKSDYNDNLAIVKDVNTKIQLKINLLTEMIRSMLGDDYVILPRFNFNDVSGITQLYNTRSDILDYSVNTLGIPLMTNEWLHGVSLVRPKMHTFEMIRMLNDTFNDVNLQLEPLQIPYRDKTSWLAVEFPSDTTIDHDTISFVSYNPQGFAPSHTQCGLLIDEWTEVIPNKEEVTGISFNYNQPNSVPPQAILLAVTPEETGTWKWENLLAVVLDTFDRAKMRAVEPDLLDQLNISVFLPALISEFSTSKSGITLDYSLNINYILEKVADLKFVNK